MPSTQLQPASLACFQPAHNRAGCGCGSPRLWPDRRGRVLLPRPCLPGKLVQNRNVPGTYLTPQRERPMVVLCCPQCQTKLPVPEEKLGKTLFVCPSCTFPLEASNQTPDSSEATVAYTPTDRVVNPGAPFKPSAFPAARPSPAPRTPVP